MGGPAVPALNEDQIFPALLRKLSDSDFIDQMVSTAGVEHSSTIKMLHFINDLERRKLFLDLGYSSVFDYCVRRIKYSSSQAGRRIQAARCCRRYPQFFGYLRTREVCLMTVAMIEPIITDDNKGDIIQRVRGASRREVERLLSEYRPPAALRDRIRYVQVPSPSPRNVDAALLDRRCARAVPEIWRDHVPTEEKAFVQFLADDEFLNLFEEVRNLVPDGGELTFADVMKTVLAEYRDRHSPAARQKRRETKHVNGAASVADAGKTGANGPDSHRWEWEDATKSRHIPDETRDQVFVRDRGQCSFVAPDGTQCECKKGLQIDHIMPYAAGGTHELSNLRLLCGAHNRLAAEKAMGKHVMQPFWRRQ
jgi:5-methylcytosine-specific restriction endonuclease McrA